MLFRKQCKTKSFSQISSPLGYEHYLCVLANNSTNVCDFDGELPFNKVKACKTKRMWSINACNHLGNLNMQTCHAQSGIRMVIISK